MIKMLRDEETLLIDRALKIIAKEIALGNLPGLPFDFDEYGIDIKEYQKPHVPEVSKEKNGYRYLTEEEYQKIKKAKISYKELAMLMGMSLKSFTTRMAWSKRGRSEIAFIEKLLKIIKKHENM